MIVTLRRKNSTIEQIEAEYVVITPYYIRCFLSGKHPSLRSEITLYWCMEKEWQDMDTGEVWSGVDVCPK